MKNIFLRTFAALLGVFLVVAGIWKFFDPVYGSLVEKGSCVSALLFGVIFLRFSIAGFR